MAWRSCTQYSLEKCGPEKPCQFNGPVSYTCSGRSFPKEGENSMPKKKTKKTKAFVERKRRPVADEYANIQKPEPAASAVQLIDSIFQRRSNLISLGAEVDQEQSHLAHEKDLLGETKLVCTGFSVNFGWSEDTDNPLGCITLEGKGGEYLLVEVSLDDLRILAGWLTEQLTRG